MNNESRETEIFQKYYSRWLSSENSRQMLTAGLMIAASVGCFAMPKMKIIATLSARSLCFFGTTQPLSVYMFVNTAEQLNNIYSIFILAANGSSRLVDFKSIQERAGEHYLSLLILPLGTTETAHVLSTIRRALTR